MAFPILNFSLSIFLLIFYSNVSLSQIVFKEIRDSHINFSDSSFLGLSETRSIFPLNGKWVVYSAEDEEPKKFSVNVPSIFKGDANLIFEKTFNIPKEQLKGKKARLYFLGLNYIADIVLNDIVVYRHRGGEYPFIVELPKDILHTDMYNLISLKLSHKLDPQYTIPLKQRFLFPANYGGIIRDVYLYFEPEISISDFKVSFKQEGRTDRIKFIVSERIDNKEFKNRPDTLDTKNEFRVSVYIFNPDNSLAGKNTESKFKLKMNESRMLNHSIDISNPVYWSPESPQLYSVGITLTLDGELIDSLGKEFPLYVLSYSDGELKLNRQPFSFKGVTYIPSFGEFGNLTALNKMEEDIRLIKQTGFNSVRFAKSVPHPYYLHLCEEYGLISFIEVPLSFVPPSFTVDNDFITRSKNYLTEFVDGYSEFGSFSALGLGSSYFANLPEHQTFLNELENSLQKEKNFLTYASFSKMDLLNNINVDLYGIEVTGNASDKDTTDINLILNQLGGKAFISSVTYFVNAGSSTGYSNENTYEAQAKYLEDFITALSDGRTFSFFINTMFNYRGDYASIISGYNENNIYNIGLMSENRSTAFLSYKVVQSKLQNVERITIPIGTKSNSSPMAFIIVGLFLALIVGVLVNSGRKFREDASRALLRPYNFFADVRDQRIMPSYHSTVLAIVLAAVMALISSSMLHYLRDNIVFEKLILSAGSENLMSIISYFAWKPLNAIIWLSLFFIAVITFAVIIIKFGSLFVKNRVFISGIYISVVWSLLPYVLLIPVGIVLYRALDADVANIYIYLVLALFVVWVFYRLIKGIYVIYDINPGKVYLYSAAVVLVLLFTFLLYFEIKNSFMDYLMLTFNQYNLGDLL